MKVRKTAIAVIFVGLLGTLYGEDIPTKVEISANPMRGWKMVVVSPMADISMPGQKTSDTDAESVVERFLKILTEHGIPSRKATQDDERQLRISMRGIIASDPQYLIRIQHQELANFMRENVSETGIATTWEAEQVAIYPFAFSSPRPFIEKAMNVLAEELAEAIRDDTTAEQNAAGQPATRPLLK